MANKPNVLWAQREDALFVTIDLKDITDQKLEVTKEKITFSGKSNEKEYAFDFEWNKPIKADDVKISTKRLLELYIPKEDAEGDSWGKLNKEGKLAYLKIDWNKWADSDDEGENFDTAGMGGMPQGMGGMGGMPGMGGMGGMPGMGGMGGGMPGMGGMDFSQMMGGMGGMPGGGEGGMGGMDMASLMKGMGKGGGDGGMGGMDMAELMKGMGGMGMGGMGGEAGEGGDSDDDDDLPDLDAPVETEGKDN